MSKKKAKTAVKPEVKPVLAATETTEAKVKIMLTLDKANGVQMDIDVAAGVDQYTIFTILIEAATRYFVTIHEENFQKYPEDNTPEARVAIDAISKSLLRIRDFVLNG